MWAVDDQGPEALLARMYASPAQGAVADAAPVIQEEGQLLLPFFAHSWHSGLPSFFCCISGRFLAGNAASVRLLQGGIWCGKG